VTIPFGVETHAVPIVILYIGPDQIMPLTSVLGAIVGFALMFWNRLVVAVRRGSRLFGRRHEPQNPDLPEPPNPEPFA